MSSLVVIEAVLLRLLRAVGAARPWPQTQRHLAATDVARADILGWLATVLEMVSWSKKKQAAARRKIQGGEPACELRSG